MVSDAEHRAAYHELLYEENWNPSGTAPYTLADVLLAVATETECRAPSSS